MNWLTNFIRPRIRQFVSPKEIPDNLWQKCDSCEGMLFHRDLEENLNVCYHCGHHLRLSVAKRLETLFDNGDYKKIDLPDVAPDPLKFRDRKKYSERIKDAQNKNKIKDAITIAKGQMGGIPVVIAAFNFSFMGGSMGAAVGEALVKASDVAVKEKAAFIVIPSSGGARMQEGMLSLIQMPRSIIAVEQVKEAKLPYIVLLTNPTTGGVSASFAMVGDIHMAEPGATIGFAGRRVIEETVRETLPEDFQTAEYLLEHGIVDMVTPRQEQRETIIRILGILMNKQGKVKNKDTKKKDDKKDSKELNKTQDAKASENSTSKIAAQISQDGSLQKNTTELQQDININNEANTNKEIQIKKAQSQVLSAQIAVQNLMKNSSKPEQKTAVNS